MITLDIDDYCNNCNEFDADVEKDIVVLNNIQKSNQTCKCNTTITCKHRFRCQNIRGYLNIQKNGEKNGEKNDESSVKKIGFEFKRAYKNDSPKDYPTTNTRK